MIKSDKVATNTAGPEAGMSSKPCRSYLKKNPKQTQTCTIIGLLIDIKSPTHLHVQQLNTKTQLRGFYNTHTPIEQAIVESIKHIRVAKSGTVVRQRPLQNIHSNRNNDQ